MRELDGLRWRQRQVTELGCIKGCLEYLGKEVSFPWLYGGTGHAFVLNIHDELCPSGPTCWNWQGLFGLTANVGYTVDGFSIEKEEAGDGFEETQRRAFDFVRGKIDGGIPCWGWELHPWIPDHYVIYGYDDGGYLYSGWAEGKLPWQKLGDTDVKVIQVYSVEPCEPASDEKTVGDALAAAVRLADDPARWTLAPAYHMGPAGFEAWAGALEAGRAIRDGHSYNASVWLECRGAAVEFLGEAERLLPGRYGSTLVEAARAYAIVRDKLSAVAALHPLKPETWDGETKLQSAAAAALIREAGVAKREAVGRLREAVGIRG